MTPAREGARHAAVLAQALFSHTPAETPARPPLDTAQPTDLATATFALG